MFTVKQITEDGTEYLFQTNDVVFTPAVAAGGGGFSSQPAITFMDIQGRSILIERGHIYVMNEQGKTVGNYHLLVEHPRAREKGL